MNIVSGANHWCHHSPLNFSVYGHHVQIRRSVDSSGTGSISFCFLHWVWSTSAPSYHPFTNFWPTQQLNVSMELG